MKDDWGHKFISKGELNVDEVYKDGQIYEMLVQVSNNIIVI